MRQLTICIACAGAVSLLASNPVNAQRRGDRQGSSASQIIRQLTNGGSQRGDAGVRARGSVSTNQSRGNQVRDRGRSPDLGQAIGNQVRNRIGNAVGDAIGLPGNVGLNNRGRDARNFNDRTLNDRGLNGRSRNSVQFGLSNGRIGNDRNARSRNSLNQNRYRNNLIAGAILSRIPEATRVLAPRNNRQRGGFYTVQDSHYFYPSQPVNQQPLSAVQPASGTYVEGSGVVNAQATSAAQPQEPVTMEFGAYAYVGQLAEIMPTVVNELCLDMHYNYRGAANFDEAYRSAYTMLQNSKQLADAHAQNDRQKVKQLAQTIDRLQHKVEDQTANWSRNETRQIGELGMVTKLQITSDTVHHLLHDIGVTESEHDQNNGAQKSVPNASPEQAPSPQN